jgi:hypothetical protein
MADYYPLIAKAVSGLEKSTGEARRALYDRARTALLAQLRGVEPPLAEPDITRERLALEEAIRKVETEAARRSRSDPPPPPSRAEPLPSRTEPPLRAARQATIVPPAPAPEEMPEARPQPAPARQTANLSAAAVRAERRQPLPPPTSEDGAGEEQVAEERAAPKAPPRTERPRWSPGSGPSLSDRGLKGFRDVVAEAETLGGASAQAAKNVRAALQPVPAPSEFETTDKLAETRADPRFAARGEGRVSRRAEPRVELPPQRPQRRPSPRDAERLLGREPVEPNREPREPPRSREIEPPRPPQRRVEPPPLDDEPDDFGEPDSFTRDDDFPRPAAPPPAKPEYPTRPPSSMVRQEDVRGRAPTMPRMARAERKPATTRRLPLAWKKYVGPGVAAVAVLAVLAIVIVERQQIMGLFRSTPGATRSADSPTDSGVRGKIADRVGSGPLGSANDGALVAQKAVLYEEDSSNPAGRQFVGTAVWRTDRVPPGPGQAPELTVRADVEIPEQRISLRWSLRRNDDKALPASHTVEIMFTLPADFPHGGIANIPGVLMKEGESKRGIPLAGLAVKVTTNFFLIGLSSVDADMQRNIQLLKDRPWFDIPIVYGDGQRAIIAIEKGTPGDRSFAEAFAAWGR